MGATFAPNVGTRFDGVLAPIPFTMACWFRVNVDDSQGLIAVYDPAASFENHNLALIASMDQAGDPLRFLAIAGGTSRFAVTTTGITVGRWHHACAVANTTADRRVYIDGGSKGTNADTRAANLVSTAIGSKGGQEFLNGDMADVAFWKVSLNDHEVAALGRGASPLRIRPESLVDYRPMIDDFQNDVLFGRRFYIYAPGVGPVPRLTKNHPTNMIYPEQAIFTSVTHHLHPKFQIVGMPPRFWMAPSPPIQGSVVWGHITGALEDNIRTFAGNWTGTGAIENSGDAERVALEAGEYMQGEVVDTGTQTVELLQNEYAVGDDVTLEYRHGATRAACEAAGWNAYTVPFASAGFVQVRLGSTL